MSDYKKFVVPVVTLGLAYTLCPVTEERQPHGPHHAYHPSDVPTIECYTSASSTSGAVTFTNAIDSADVVIGAHGARRNAAWAWASLPSGSTSSAILTLK
jgi:hypothetical protein